MLKPSIFNPSKDIKSINNLVIALNGKPLLGIGEYEDTSSHVEVEKLMNSSAFKLMVDAFYQFESDNLQIKKIHGSNISWKDEEVCLLKESNDNIHWVVFGDRANRLANAISSNEEIKELFQKEKETIDITKKTIKKNKNN